MIPRLAVRVQRGVGDMLLDLVPVNGDTNATLNLTNKLMTQATVVNANIPASMGWVFLDLSASPLTLAAGKYGIVITAATGKVHYRKDSGGPIGHLVFSNPDN